MYDLFSQPPLTGVRDTSRANYEEHGASGKLGEQQQHILTFLQRNTSGYTRAELATAIGMRLSSVCGRVNELLKRGLIDDEPRRTCKVTGRTAHVISVIPERNG